MIYSTGLSWFKSGSGLCLLLFVFGCASSPVDTTEAPRHPFPRWVSHLESGQTQVDQVEETFGTPVEIEEHANGTMIWRYRYEEIHWSPNDPRRPEVAADGTPLPFEPNWQSRTLDALRDTGDALDRLLFYPPIQPKRHRKRSLPATIHDLELVFAADGELRSYRYAPRAGIVLLR